MTVKKLDKVLLFFFVAAIISSLLIWAIEERFEQSAWNDSPSIRYKIADDLIDSKLLIGKTQPDVISILGQPDASNLKGRHNISYRLGKGPSFSKSKEEHLLVIFEDGVVAKVVLLKP
nr:hypothetical protein [uncultured Psychroserpens sp.]